MIIQTSTKEGETIIWVATTIAVIALLDSKLSNSDRSVLFETIRFLFFYERRHHVFVNYTLL